MDEFNCNERKLTVDLIKNSNIDVSISSVVRLRNNPIDLLE
jgi:hypothetical protein